MLIDHFCIKMSLNLLDSCPSEFSVVQLYHQVIYTDNSEFQEKQHEIDHR